MSRLAPNERTRPPIPLDAWKVVTGETLIEDSEGHKAPATRLIYTWYRDWLGYVTKMSIGWVGHPMRPGFKWRSKDSRAYFGRSVVDLAQDLEGEALEAAARAVQTNDLAKEIPLIPWIRRIMWQHLSKELDRWQHSNSSVSDVNVTHEPLAFEGDDTAPPDLALGEDDPNTDINRAMCVIALDALSAMEREALLRFSEGESYHEIARNLQVHDATSARRIVQRARRKAMEALQ